MRWCCCGKKSSGMSVVMLGGIYIAIIMPMMNKARDKREQAQIGVVSALVEQSGEEDAMVSKDVLGYEFEMLDGSMISLEDYRGSVLMFVNVASACGLTPQYAGLERLYKKYKDDGFMVVGFPANEFGAQEPGSNAEIAEFCSQEYGVTFPMMGKIVVKGEGVHPLYAQLASQQAPIGGEPEWNFVKFLVNRSGEVVSRFPSRTTPENLELIASVELLIAED